MPVRRSGAKPKPASSALSERTGEIVGLCLIGFAVFLAMSLWTFHAGDPSWGSRVNAEWSVRNYGGVVGAHAAGVMVQTLGAFSALMPVGLILWGVAAFAGLRSWRPGWRGLVGLLWLLSASGLLYKAFAVDPLFGAPTLAGGMVGYLVVKALETYLGGAGSGLSLVFVFLAALVGATGFSLRKLAAAFAGAQAWFLSRFFARMKKAARKASRGAASRARRLGAAAMALRLSLRRRAPADEYEAEYVEAVYAGESEAGYVEEYEGEEAGYGDAREARDEDAGYADGELIGAPPESSGASREREAVEPAAAPDDSLPPRRKNGRDGRRAAGFSEEGGPSLFGGGKFPETEAFAPSARAIEEEPARPEAALDALCGPATDSGGEARGGREKAPPWEDEPLRPPADEEEGAGPSLLDATTGEARGADAGDAAGGGAEVWGEPISQDPRDMEYPEHPRSAPEEEEQQQPHPYGDASLEAMEEIEEREEDALSREAPAAPLAELISDDAGRRPADSPPANAEDSPEDDDPVEALLESISGGASGDALPENGALKAGASENGASAKGAPESAASGNGAPGSGASGNGEAPAGDVKVRSAGADGEAEVVRIQEDSLVRSGAGTETRAVGRRPPEPRQEYRLPSLEIFADPPAGGLIVDEAAIREKSLLLEQTLGEFGVSGKVTEVKTGPVITIFEYDPAPGIKVSKITGLADDLARALSALSVRIVAPIPGKSVVGIEVPNLKRGAVFAKEVFSSREFLQAESKLTMGLGKDILGRTAFTDLATIPHLLIAGTTGSGKSVALNMMICSLLARRTPREVRFLMIDPKMLELSIYEGVPHQLVPVVTDPKKAAAGLRGVLAEMERRYRLMSEAGVRNIQGYNESVARQLGERESERRLKEPPSGESEALDFLPYVVVVIDELADLMMVAPREVEESMTRLAQMARASGIHLLVATQRPSVDVLTGLIKANFPSRMALRVATRTDSRTILDANGAERLLGKGDMLFVPPGSSVPVRIHGAYVSDEEISQLVAHWKGQGSAVFHEDWFVEEESASAGEEGEEEEHDERYDDAIALVARTREASISLIQRHLRIGYNRAARMIERMEQEGIIGPADGVKRRQVLVSEIPGEEPVEAS